MTTKPVPSPALAFFFFPQLQSGIGDEYYEQRPPAIDFDE